MLRSVALLLCATFLFCALQCKHRSVIVYPERLLRILCLRVDISDVEMQRDFDGEFLNNFNRNNVHFAV